jgi:hypothetical protein
MALFSTKANRRQRRSRQVAVASPMIVVRGRGEREVVADAKPASHGRLRTVVLASAAAILIWLVVAHSLVLYLADAAPKAALWFDAQQPEALINVADQLLNAHNAAPDGAAAGQGPQEPSAGAADSGATEPDQTSGAPPASAPAIAAPQPSNSTKVNSAFESFGQYQTVDLAAIREKATTALLSDPLDPRALRILGQAADAAGNAQDAFKYMHAAAALSSHETIAQYWLMRKTTEAGDYQDAIRYADVMMRSNDQLAQYVVPYLAHFAGNQATIGAVKTLVDADPPWRSAFFSYLYPSVTDVRTPLAILLSLKPTQAPPTAEELNGYLTYLVQHRFYNLAYYAWLQFLSPEELQHVGLLYNGNFATPPSGSQFDWQITQGSGVAVDIEPADAGQQALTVDFLYGRVDYQSVSELVMLAPGTYRFQGQYKGELIGPRGLKWRVACAEDNAAIAESPMIGGEVQQWTDLDFTFTVPATKCAAQYIRLDLDARMASEQLVTGSMMFTALTIARSDAAAAVDDESEPEDADKPKP